MPDVGQHVQDLDSSDVVCRGVEDEAPEWRQVLSVMPAVELLENTRPDGMGDDPEMGHPVWEVWHRIILLEDRNGLSDLCRMNLKNVKNPVLRIPCTLLGLSPSRLHGIPRSGHIRRLGRVRLCGSGRHDCDSFATILWLGCVVVVAKDERTVSGSTVPLNNKATTPCRHKRLPGGVYLRRLGRSLCVTRKDRR